jgi:phosphatidate cytidylyltransferase
MAPPEDKPATANLVQRSTSAAVLAAATLAAVYWGSPVFDWLIAVAALILAWEWNRLCAGRRAWLAGGLLYIVLPSWALLYLRADPLTGAQTLFWLMAVVWAADTGAYAFGRWIGGPKMIPVISPKKTWSGLIGGVGSAGAVGAVTAILLEKNGFLGLFWWSAMIGAISQAGDLAESWVKRHFGVKDTSEIIPGHGGLFDRVDGLLAAALAVAVITLVGNGSLLTWM